LVLGYGIAAATPVLTALLVLVVGLGLAAGGLTAP
jgi:hypothetical protein